MVSIEHARPKVDFPADAPPRCLVAALFQRGMCGLEKFRLTEWRNLVAGIQAVEVRDMTVLVARIVHVLQPFLQLTVPAYLHGWQAVYYLPQRILERLPVAHHTSGLQRVAQRIEHDLVVHRASACYGTVLGGNRRSDDPPVVLRMLYKKV